MNLGTEVSQQNAGLLLAETDRRRAEPFILIDPGLDGLGNSQPSKMAKDTKMKRFTLRKACSREKHEGCGCITSRRYLRSSEVTSDHKLSDLSSRDA